MKVCRCAGTPPRDLVCLTFSGRTMPNAQHYGRNVSISTWGPAEWAALGQVGALIVAIVAGLLVYRQVKDGQQIREDQTRPYVIVDLDFRGFQVALVVKNVGASPARDVKVTFDQPLRRPYPDDDPTEEFAVFSRGIPMLAPGRSIRIDFGTGPSFFPTEGGGVPLRYEATVRYTSLDGKKAYDDPPLVLDLLPFKHTLMEREDLHDIAMALKDMRSQMKTWTSGQRLRVNVRTQHEINESDRELRERRSARAAAAEAVPTVASGAEMENAYKGPEDALSHLLVSAHVLNDKVIEALQRSTPTRDDVLTRIIGRAETSISQIGMFVDNWRVVWRTSIPVPNVPRGYELQDWFPIGNGQDRAIALWRVGAAPESPVPPGTAPDAEAEIAIFLDEYDPQELDAVDAAVRVLARSLGYNDFQLESEVSGSIFRRLRGKIQDGVASDYAQARLSELEQRFTLEAVGRTQAEVDAIVTDNAVQLIAALADIPNAVVRVGALMVIKYTNEAGGPVMLQRQLTSIEIRALERNPGIQAHPARALELLSIAVRELPELESPGNTAAEADGTQT